MCWLKRPMPLGGVGGTLGWVWRAGAAFRATGFLRAAFFAAGRFVAGARFLVADRFAAFFRAGMEPSSSRGTRCSLMKFIINLFPVPVHVTKEEARDVETDRDVGRDAPGTGRGRMHDHG